MALSTLLQQADVYGPRKSDQYGKRQVFQAFHALWTADKKEAAELRAWQGEPPERLRAEVTDRLLLGTAAFTKRSADAWNPAPSLLIAGRSLLKSWTLLLALACTPHVQTEENGRSSAARRKRPSKND